MIPFFDVAYQSINKHDEELCGDNVEIINDNNGIMAVLSDGLGSGVKANILATLTSKIAITMLHEGADIEETIDTIVNTLPECHVRKLAYSTFTIIKIDNDMNLYIAEYDNPPIFIYRKGFLLPIERKEIIINDKKIYESRVKLQIGDMIAVVSDGAVHAGVGALLNLGWQWDDINEYLMDLNKLEKTSKKLAMNFINVCNNLYDNYPGDDTTILTIKVRDPEFIDLFTGPPVNKTMDEWIINKLEHSRGKKIICGGTTANIASRVLKRALNVDIKTMTREIPPLAYMDGYDLITEGVLTLQKTLGKLRQYAVETNDTYYLEGEDAASRLAKVLIEDCTHLNLWFGKSVNPAHQNPDFPIDFNIKLKIVSEIIKELKNLGKNVEITYI
jgi:hypothetical protein